MNDLITVHFQCAYCGEENETFIDPSGGGTQSYTEDCSVCCRPNVLRIIISPQGDISLDVEFEG